MSKIPEGGGGVCETCLLTPHKTTHLSKGAVALCHFGYETPFLSAIFIFCGLTLLLVAEISEQPRNIFADMSGLDGYFSKPIFVVVLSTMNPIIK